MNVLIIDNYDSFTFNLYQYVGELLKECNETFAIDVFRNDEITLQEIKDKKYDRIIISPGPGDPADETYFGICSEVIKDLGVTTPLLGVCLGMQGMAHVFGGTIVRAKKPMHGKTSLINHDEKGVFHKLPQHLSVMRYHSLIVDKASLPYCFDVSAVSDDTDEIMGIRHKTLPIEGIQFHPESFATEGGKDMLRIFLFKKL